MTWPDLNPVEPPPPPPEVPWTMWALGAGLLCICIIVAVLILRRTITRPRKIIPAPDPRKRALDALLAIPDDWPTERRAAAGARILRGFFAVLALGPGTAHPAKYFLGLRAAEPWRELANLLVEMESLSCHRNPPHEAWLAARERAAACLRDPLHLPTTQ